MPETEVAGSTLVLRRADEADIPFVMATERRPGYERTVGRWEAEAHRAEMLKSGSAYLLGERGGRPEGFAMLLDLDAPDGTAHLKRLAVAEPGRGVGRALLGAVLDWTFAREGVRRLRLHVAVANAPARHLYRSLGFRDEGVAPGEHVNPAGEPMLLLRMEIARGAWSTARP